MADFRNNFARILCVAAMAAMAPQAASAAVIQGYGPPASADALKNGKFISFETGNESASNSRTYDIVTILGTTELNDFSGQYNTTGRSLGNNRGGTTNITFQFDNAVSAFGFNLGATDSNWSLSANGETYTFLPVSSGNGMNFYGIASKRHHSRDTLICRRRLGVD